MNQIDSLYMNDLGELPPEQILGWGMLNKVYPKTLIADWGNIDNWGGGTCPGEYHANVLRSIFCHVFKGK